MSPRKTGEESACDRKQRPHVEQSSLNVLLDQNGSSEPSVQSVRRMLMSWNADNGAGAQTTNQAYAADGVEAQAWPADLILSVGRGGAPAESC